MDEKLPERCCGRCANGTEKIIPGALQKAIECMALPPVPVIMPGPNGAAGIQSLWPLLDPRKCCGCFTPREIQN